MGEGTKASSPRWVPSSHLNLKIWSLGSNAITKQVGESGS